MARQADRLDRFYDELKAIHKEHFYDWRFGQLVTNFLCWLMNDKGMDIFFPEEEKMLEYIKEYSEQYRNEYPVYINNPQSDEE